MCPVPLYSFLIHQIEKDRQALIREGLAKGLQHRDTLKVSKRLDKLINLMQRV